MMGKEKFSLQSLEIITLINQTQKTEVYLVTTENLFCGREKFAVLKKYKRELSIEHYYRIAELISPYFPMLYDVWKEDGNTYLLEEYIPGRTLQEKLDVGEFLQESEITYYMAELCQALKVLHGMEPPVIHRDLKPENVIITVDGKVRLLDFDASREYKEHQEHDTIALGTREYAPPEQFGFAQTDVRSDIYSWGIIFAELLEHGDVSKRYVNKVRKIIDRATMFDPERRYDDIEAVLTDLWKVEKRQSNRYLLLAVVSGLVVMVLLAESCLRQDTDTTLMSQITPQSPETSLERLPSPESSPSPEPLPSPESSPSPEPLPSPESSPSPEPLLSPESSYSSEPSQESSKASDLGNKRTEFPTLNAVYHYVPIKEGMREKVSYLMAAYPNLYIMSGYHGDDDGVYGENQETIMGRDYVALRFLKSYPRDVVLCDDRMCGLEIDSVLYSRYIEELGAKGDWIYLDSTNYSHEFENIVSISAEFFQTLEPGGYTLQVNMRNGGNSMPFLSYLVVHGEEEKVDNFRVHIFNEIGYYSSEAKNDVVFYISNTPFPVKEICVGNYVLQEGEYDLADEGLGVVLHSEILERYKDLQSIDFVITMENDKQVGYRVINMDLFYE